MYLWIDIIVVKNTSNLFSAPVVCKNDEFKCSNDKCIPKIKMCDGANDCGDYSDEGKQCGKYIFLYMPMYFCYLHLIFHKN